MHKKDFIQSAATQFMPHTEWNIDKAISYAEKLWIRLSERGYGEPKQTGTREITKAYDKLNPVMKAAFDVFWMAFDLKRGKDEAAAAWLQLDPSKTEQDAIIKAAKQAAQERKNLPAEQVPIMAQGWLNKRRYLDMQTSGTEKQLQKTDQKAREIQRLTGELNHAKGMATQTGDAYWTAQIPKLTDQLKQLRDQP